MIYKTKKLLDYLINGKTKYRLHSPFVFEFMMKVLHDKRHYYAFEEILTIKNSTSRIDKNIQITDLGAGSDGSIKKERSVKSIVNKSAIAKKYGELLFRIVQFYKPINVIELGTCVGIGTMYMALADSKIPVITIEGDPNIGALATSNFKKYSKKIENINQVIGNFDDCLQPILDNLDEIGLAFIDGNHRKEPTLKYFNQLLNKCTKNSILIFDDIYWSKEMGEAWEEIKSHPKVTLTIDLFRMGLVFFIDERKEVEHFKLYF